MERYVETVTHNLGEGSYAVVGTDRRGWALTCTCGWRSPLYETREQASAAIGAHLETPVVRPSWRERRRDRLTGSRDDRRQSTQHR